MKRRRNNRTRQRTERKTREAFREIMQKFTNEKTIQHNTKWGTIAEMVKDEKWYRDLLLQTGSKPIDIFKDFQDTLKEEFNGHKVAFKKLLKSKSIKLGVDISKEDFDKNLNEQEEYASLANEIKSQLYDYYIYKVNQKKGK